MGKKKKSSQEAIKADDNLIPKLKTKDRYCKHLTPEENQMLDIIADIIAGYVLKNGGKAN